MKVHREHGILLFLSILSVGFTVVSVSINPMNWSFSLLLLLIPTVLFAINSLRQSRKLSLLKHQMEDLLFRTEISEKIIEKNPCMIYAKDWDGHYYLANASFAEAFGVTAKDIIGKSEKDFNSNAPDIEERLDEDREIMNGTKDKIVYECAFQNSKGEDRWLHVIKLPIIHKGNKYLLGVATDITERRQHEEIVYQQAHYDGLTGLPNRLKFYSALKGHLEKAENNNLNVSLLFIDLDRFKLINDTLGHSIGDTLLIEVSVRLRECLDSTYELYRLAGDEFTIILPNGDYDVAELVAIKVIDELAKPLFIEGHEFVITPSIGISVYPYDGATAEKLVQQADTAMYIAKDQGKNTYRFYKPEQKLTTSKRLMLEHQLRKAIDNEEFLLFFQPKMNLQTGKLIGVEALIRWNHPELGMISPAEFIPLAEETGLIVPMGEWVLREACRQNKAWQDAGIPPFMVSVNLSALQFRHDLTNTVNTILKETGLDGQWLELEITESILMLKEESIIVILNSLREKGIKISIDDFGTGYSTLMYLKNFPLDTLKIAQPFIRDIAQDSTDAAIATALINLGHSLKLNVIAEGVEDQEQLRFLTEHHCDEIQGYLLSRPLPERDFMLWLQETMTKEDRIKSFCIKELT
ncbi:EAL domain-containing protein [Neobacillus sp. D3-1R]|uniref:sensor domain-containing protein n=1 Tax=Neobacillus sp. D3-1R TaxID=3445778 RepID=UPI003FA191CC